MNTMLDLWSYESGGQELYALTSGRIPPAEEHLIKNWKRLSARVEATENAVAKITYERPRSFSATLKGKDITCSKRNCWG